MRQEDQKLLEDLDWAADRGTAASKGLEEFILDIKSRVEARLQDANDFEEAFDEVSTSIQRLNLECQRTMKSSQRLVVTLKNLKK